MTKRDTCLLITSILIPGVGLIYSIVKNKQLKKQNEKLLKEKTYLEAKAKVLEIQNRELFEVLSREEPDSSATDSKSVSLSFFFA